METKTEDCGIASSRLLTTRILFAVIWLVIIYFVVAAVTGALVGVFSGSSAGSAEDAYAAAEAASVAFFERYVLVVMLSVVVLVVTLSWYGMLPGTGKDKGIRYRDRWEALPPPLRAVMSVVIAAFVGGVWGVFTVLVGAPQSVISVGAVVIVTAVATSLHRSSK